ncbi:MAG: LysE family transporter [Chitinophagaceae bacterium]|nr:LysE family transporter [Chitinophagaceae bacterium]
MWEAILHGLTLGLILSISVGPVIFTIIKQSLDNGPTGGFSFIAGVWLSDVLLVVVSNAFAELLKGLMEYKKAIGVVGSLFLIGMGVVYIFFKKVKLQTSNKPLVNKFRTRDILKIFSSGFLINTLNPNVFSFWLVTATAFTAEFSLAQRILIFSVCIGINILADILKVILAGRLRTKLTLHTIAIINKVSGSILIAFGVALFYGAIFLSDRIA